MSKQTDNPQTVLSCFIGKSQKSIQSIKEDPLLYEIDSPLAGGKYKISANLWNSFISNNSFNPKEKTILSAWIARENLKDNNPNLDLLIDNTNRKSKDDFLNKLPAIPDPRERAYLLLEGLVKKSNSIGKQFSYDNFLNLFSDSGCFNDHDFSFSQENIYESAFCYALSY